MASTDYIDRSQPRKFLPEEIERKSRTRSKSAFGTGVATIIMIMVILMLAVFSILSFAQANSDYKLSEKGVSSSQVYYSADSQAQIWLAHAVAVVKARGADAATVLSQEGNEAKSIDGGRVGIMRDFKIDEKRVLRVNVEIGGAGDTKVLQWQTIVLDS